VSWPVEVLLQRTAPCFPLTMIVGVPEEPVAQCAVVVVAAAAVVVVVVVVVVAFVDACLFAGALEHERSHESHRCWVAT
jgi:hypothetical protein